MHDDGLTPQVKEDLVRLLLPYLMAGLGASITADYRAATLMIVTQLASQATLSDSLLAGTPSSSLPQLGLACRQAALTAAVLMMTPFVSYQSCLAL